MKVLSKIGHFFKGLFYLRLELLFYNFVPLLVFEVLYKCFGIYCVTPILLQFFEFSTNFTGFDYLIDSNFVSFLLNPISILAVLICLIVIALYSLIDIGTLIYIFEQSRLKKRVSLNVAIQFGIRNSLRLLQPKNWLLYPFLLLLMPLVNIGVCSNYLRSIDLPVSLFENTQTNPVVFFLIIAVLIVAMVIMFKWYFVSHYFTLEQCSALQAFKRSASLVRTDRIKNFISMMCIQATIALINSILVFIANNVINAAYSSFASDSLFFEIGMFVITIVFFACYIVITSLFMPLSCLKISSVYYGNKEKSQEELLLSYNQLSLNTSLFKMRHASNRYKTKFAISIFVVLVCIAFGVIHVADNVSYTMAESVETEVISNMPVYSKSGLAQALERVKAEGADCYYAPLCVVDAQEAYVLGNSSYALRTSTNALDYQDIGEDVVEGVVNNGMSFFQNGVNDNIESLSETLQISKDLQLKLILRLDFADSVNKEEALKYITNLIEESGCTQSCSLCSNDIQTIEQIKSINSHINTTFRQMIAMGNFSNFSSCVDNFMYDSTFLNREQINSFHKSGYKAFVCCAGDSSIEKTAARFGADAICVPNINSSVKAAKSDGTEQFIKDAYKRYAVISIFQDLV